MPWYILVRTGHGANKRGLPANKSGKKIERLFLTNKSTAAHHNDSADFRPDVCHKGGRKQGTHELQNLLSPGENREPDYTLTSSTDAQRSGPRYRSPVSSCEWFVMKMTTRLKSRLDRMK